ncbi:hypothetical protein D1006_22300 [Burkholderia stabilis]|uniref:Uncharacterized protein n=2 Tax=Burkholderia stabilis TaxID=95485 RepID=A0A4Q2AF05_9BURK|nr:hypothetical protein D1006_22300 [Burkholderia stabilis]
MHKLRRKEVSETLSNDSEPKDHFAVAQVALYIFAVLQVVAALMAASGAMPLGVAPQASLVQRISLTIGTVVNILFFVAGYVLLARYLTCCSKVVWRIALAVFLINIGMAALALAAQPGPHPVLVGSLSIAGAISVWKGREAVGRTSIATSGN